MTFASLLLFVTCLLGLCASCVLGPESLTGLDVHRLSSLPANERAAGSDSADGPRVLLVTAHPDDEIACAGTLYKLATHLRGTCDLFVVTDGDAGFKYATLATRIYGADLTDPTVGRARLPAIRRSELIASGEVLGLRQIVFLHQIDPRYTKDPAEVLQAGAKGWDLAAVRGALARVLRAARYDCVLTFLPVADTHGHHKAASLLALAAVADLPLVERPVVLGVIAGSADAPSPSVADEFAGLMPLAGNRRADDAADEDDARRLARCRIRRDVGPFVFDRRQKFGYRDQLDYQIVINWAIAAHRSQGTMQMLAGRFVTEVFYVYALPISDARLERVRAWFVRLAEPQFTTRSYPD